MSARRHFRMRLDQLAEQRAAYVNSRARRAASRSGATPPATIAIVPSDSKRRSPVNLLEREYASLRSQRVALRRKREDLIKAVGCAPQNRYGPNGYDNLIAMTEAALRGTERRWIELHALLRKPLPGPPVKLNAPARAQPVQLRGAATRSAMPGYLTRMLTPR